MAVIKLDKNLATSRDYEVNAFYEHPLSNQINGSYSIVVTPGSEYPEIPSSTNPEFTTIEVVNDSGVEIPLVGTYDVIKDLTINYFESEGVYGYTILIGKEE